MSDMRASALTYADAGGRLGAAFEQINAFEQARRAEILERRRLRLESDGASS